MPGRDDKFGWIKCLLIAIVAYSVAFAFNFFNSRAYSIPLYFANSAAGLAWFALGYGFSRYETKWWMVVPCILGYIAYYVGGFTGIGMRENVCADSITYLLTLPAGFCGIVTFNMLCRFVARYLHYLSLPFIFCGRYAMIIYVSHGLMYAAVLRIFDIYGLPALRSYVLWLIIAIYAVCIPLCYFIEMLCRRLFGKFLVCSRKCISLMCESKDGPVEAMNT